VYTQPSNEKRSHPMNELIRDAECLKALLTKELQKSRQQKESEYTRFSRLHKMRRMPITEAKKPLLTFKTQPLDRVRTSHQLVAYIINAHVLSKDILAIEALEQHGDLNFVLHYRKGKETEAAALIDKAIKACQPVWRLNIDSKTKRLHMQCKGLDYLPTLLAYCAKQTFDTQILVKPYKLETNLSSPTDTEPSYTVCRRVLGTDKRPTPRPELISEVSALLRDTKTRVVYADSFFKNIKSQCARFINDQTNNDIFRTLKTQAFLIYTACLTYEKNPAEALKQIQALYDAMLEKFPDISKHHEKHYNFDAFLNLCTMYATAENLNVCASRDPVIFVKTNLTLIESVLKNIEAIAAELKQKKDLVFILENTAKDIKALMDFYNTPDESDKTKKAKTALASKIHEALVEAYSAVFNNFMNQLRAPIFAKNDELEVILQSNLRFTEKLEEFSSVEELHENALSCQLSVLGVMLKYYRDIENWDLLAKTAEHYFEVMQVVPSHLFSDYDKAIIPFAMRFEFAVARENLAEAFEHYQSLCECFFDLTKDKNFSFTKKLFDICNLGKRLVVETGMKENYLAILSFTLKTLAQIQKLKTPENEKTLTALQLFKDCCETLERTHVQTLIYVMEDSAEDALPFTYEALCISPVDSSDLYFFKSAFKSIRTKSNENCLVLTHPHEVDAKQLKHALIRTAKLKNVQQEKAEPLEKEEDSDGVDNTYPLSSFYSGPASPTRRRAPIGRSIFAAIPAEAPEVFAPRAPLVVDFGEKYAAYEIVALESGHHPLGAYFAYIDGDEELQRFRDKLKEAHIVGPVGQGGIKFFKIGDEKTCKIKIGGSDLFLVGELVETPHTRNKLIRFYKLENHAEEKNKQKNPKKKKKKNKNKSKKKSGATPPVMKK
jgi:hypothetical protein